MRPVPKASRCFGAEAVAMAAGEEEVPPAPVAFGYIPLFGWRNAFAPDPAEKGFGSMVLRTRFLPPYNSF